MSVTSTQEICAEPGCEAEVRATGYCNAHYLLHYRTERNQFWQEAKRVQNKLGPPADYLCDGDPSCKVIPVRWWVKAGDPDEPLALCPAHTEEILISLRKDVRRLELKV